MKTRRARKARSKTKRGGVYMEVGSMVALFGIALPIIAGMLLQFKPEEYTDEKPI